MAQANLILCHVEELISGADQLELKAQGCDDNIKRNDVECQAFWSDIGVSGIHREVLVEHVAGLQTRLSDLRRELREIREEFEEKQRRVSQLRDEEDRYAVTAAAKQAEADEALEQSKEAEYEAVSIELELVHLCARQGIEQAL